VTSHIVILGAGTGGTLAANRLRRALSDVEITIIDQDDRHVYQPGLLFVPFGSVRLDEIVRSRAAQLHDGIAYRQCEIDHVDLDANLVHLSDQSAISYDVLVIATGAVLVPEETDGLLDALQAGNVFTFYESESAVALHGALERFEGGRLVVGVIDMPIKCPVAPLEFCFLADSYFRRRGIRDQIDLTYVTPLDGAFTKPTASKALGGLLEEKNITVVTEFNTGEVDSEHGRLISYDEREVNFDLAVMIPLHGGANYVGRSPGLGDELNFVPVDAHTLQSGTRPNVFSLGDAAALPLSKAGSVAHFEGATLVENIARYLSDKPLDASFDGHVNCFIESGSHKALLIDFNYDNEPLGGHYPTVIGLPLLKESRFNHLGKVMFQWIYWHSLLPGRDIPGVTNSMPSTGKHKVTAT
jgi:sulfide:quinone oxidoreductase